VIEEDLDGGVGERDRGATRDLTPGRSRRQWSGEGLGHRDGNSRTDLE
jgi:hypothetical protein